jgi:hypothetical protein
MCSRKGTRADRPGNYRLTHCSPAMQYKVSMFRASFSEWTDSHSFDSLSIATSPGYRGTMLFSIILLCFFEVALALVPRVPTSESSNVCKSDIYAKLAPLKYYAPAQSFCSKKYLNIATVTANKVKRSIPPATTTTTRTTTTTTTPTTTTTTTTSTTTTSTRTSTSTTSKSTTKAKCTKDALACLYSSVIGDGAKTVSLSDLGICLR